MTKYIDIYEDDRATIRTDYHKEIHWLAKRHNCNVNEIRIDPYHPTGEVCIFIRDVWFGYIDSEFYKMVDGIPSSWD